MGLTFRQISTPRGHVLVAETDVADGHVRIEETWQHLTDVDGQVADAVLVLREVQLNGGRVLDPVRAAALWAEAMTTRLGEA